MDAKRQHGGVGIMILLLMVLVMSGYLATYALQRVSTGGHERAATERFLAIAANALDQFAAANMRLPCPANPTMSTGVEAQATLARCSFDEGTLPWATLGMNQSDAIDGWGRKLSYRVYDGNAGSLTQPGGVSMVECDTVEPTAGNKTGVAAGLGGLCVSNADYKLRSTKPANFLAGKGFMLNDYGTAHNDVAYVVISHGPTGFGGYTVSGARLEMPKGAELDNTRDTGDFTIKAFSNPDTAADAVAHFDDLLIYRTLPDLIERARLTARDWPEI
jgi:hypothetical protein